MYISVTLSGLVTFKVVYVWLLSERLKRNVHNPAVKLFEI